jgi:glycosyltransferase involved in cell wall biosynthesis
MAPLVSILIPTRNRAALLAQALESALQQSYGEVEIVVSNNASDDGTEATVANYADRRLVYVRTKEPITLVENWNNAWRQCTGDYVIMIGDDDYLLPSAIATYVQVVTKSRLDIVFSTSAVYVYPDYPDTHFRNTVVRSASNYGEYEIIPARRLLESIFSFRYPFATQTVLYSRRMLERVATTEGPYRAPFPDHYCAGASLLHTDAVAKVNRPLMLLGQTACSSGVSLLYSNARQERWVDEAKSSAAAMDEGLGLIAGNVFLNGYFASLQSLKDLFPERCLDYSIAMEEYYEVSAVQCDRAERFGGAFDAATRVRMRETVRSLARADRLRIYSRIRADRLRSHIPLALLTVLERMVRGQSAKAFVAMPESVTSILECAVLCTRSGFL